VNATLTLELLQRSSSYRVARNEAASVGGLAAARTDGLSIYQASKLMLSLTKRRNQSILAVALEKPAA
jgi:hypothetical protein